MIQWPVSSGASKRDTCAQRSNEIHSVPSAAMAKPSASDQSPTRRAATGSPSLPRIGRNFCSITPEIWSAARSNWPERNHPRSLTAKKVRPSSDTSSPDSPTIASECHSNVPTCIRVSAHAARHQRQITSSAKKPAHIVPSRTAMYSPLKQQPIKPSEYAILQLFCPRRSLTGGH